MEYFERFCWINQSIKLFINLFVFIIFQFSGFAYTPK